MWPKWISFRNLKIFKTGTPPLHHQKGYHIFSYWLMRKLIPFWCQINQFLIKKMECKYLKLDIYIWKRSFLFPWKNRNFQIKICKFLPFLWQSRVYIATKYTFVNIFDVFFATNRKFLEFCGIPTVIPLTLDGELIEQSIIDVISGYKMVREG